MTTDQIEEPDTAPARERRWRRHLTLRRAAVGAWVAVLVGWTLAWGVPYEAVVVVGFATAGAAAVSIGRPKPWRVFLDFAPLAVLLVTWDYLRGICTSLRMPTWWTPQIRVDRWLFGGTEPTVWVTEHLRRATPQWWDVPISVCYMSFFLMPLATAAVLWVRDRRGFFQWSGRYVALSYLCFLVFALAPTAPPWAAARCTAAQVARHPNGPRCMDDAAAARAGGLLGAPVHAHTGVTAVERWSTAGLSELHLSVARKVVETGQDFADRVAAVPSLHAGASLLVALFLWRRVRPRWRPVLALYPAFMAFTLVYAAEHYVVDVLVGFAFALITAVLSSRVERRWFPAAPEALSGNARTVESDRVP